MTMFDRRALRLCPLSERTNLLSIREVAVQPTDKLPHIGDSEAEQIARVAERVKTARAAGKPVILTYGAHLIKNGLGPVLIRLMERGWVTHVATNGAGSIHDWEFAYQGMSGEDVRENTALGAFGLWHETGLYLNLAIALGAADGLGYGASVGRMITAEGLDIPSISKLHRRITESCREAPDETAAAQCDLFHVLADSELPEGWLRIEHPFKGLSVQRAAYELGVPCTIHPGIGYDIIHTHPAACGGSIGRGAYLDFLQYAHGVSRIDGGVHIAVGSSVMAPMIFEKSMSMANNLAIQERGSPISDHYMVVVDIQAGGNWDWSKGEPPKEHTAYYLRFCKSFYRMGGALDYICLDNRAFLQHLWSRLEKGSDNE